jgi:hypothetical protein
MYCILINKVNVGLVFSDIYVAMPSSLLHIFSK